MKSWMRYLTVAVALLATVAIVVIVRNMSDLDLLTNLERTRDATHGFTFFSVTMEYRQVKS